MMKVVAKLHVRNPTRKDTVYRYGNSENGN